MKALLLGLCLTAIAVPAGARNAEDYWCGKGTDKIHLMMWIAKVQEPTRDDEGKLVRDDQGNLTWGRAADGRTYSQYGIINHKLPEDHPKWVTVVPKRWIRFDTEDNIYFRGRTCTLFTETDQDKYGVGYFGPRHDLRYPHIKGKIPEVIKTAGPLASEPSMAHFCVSVIEPPAEVVKDPEYHEDKWLALREGPGSQFKLITKLGGYEPLEADATKGDWTHISKIKRLNSTENSAEGWVRSKYVKKFPCQNDPNAELVPANPDATPDHIDKPTVPPVMDTAAQFDNFARSAVGKTVAEVANILAAIGPLPMQPSASNKSAAAKFITAAKGIGLAPDSQITSQVLSDPAMAMPLAKSLGIGVGLSDEQWRQAHADAFYAAKARQEKNAIGPLPRQPSAWQPATRHCGLAIQKPCEDDPRGQDDLSD